MTTEGFGPGRDAPAKAILNGGEIGGKAWVPGESDVSIRPGWFWRESENDKVKSLHHLLYIYYSSVGHNSLLLLNVPPDTRGLIHECDAARLKEFRQALDEIFDEDLAKGASVEASATRGRKFRAENLIDDDYDSYWSAGDDVKQASITLEFTEPKTFNRVQLQEYIPLGQRVAAFTIDVLDEDGSWKPVARETTIGYKRIVHIPVTTTSAVRVNVEEALACPVLNGFALFMDNIYVSDELTKLPAGEVRAASEPLVVDTGEPRSLKGFVYVPKENGEGGVITTYKIEASSDCENWTLVCDEMMFENVLNNPVAQEVVFERPIWTRLLRLTPIRVETGTGSAPVPSVTYGVSAFAAR
jgi:alpha-L-fucosidase